MSRFLVDTHAFLWWRSDDARLSRTAREAIADPRSVVMVSAASAWEIAIKRSLGKLEAPYALIEEVVERGFAWLPVTPEHAWAVRELPPHHRDPFDRLLIAQASVEDATMISGDSRFRAYPVSVRW